MLKETGEFFNNISKNANPHDYIFFSLGEKITIKDHEFIICEIKNNRMILRSHKQPPTFKEQKLIERNKTYMFDKDGNQTVLDKLEL